MCINLFVITETAFGRCSVTLCVLESKIFICVENDNFLQEEGEECQDPPVYPEEWSYLSVCSSLCRVYSHSPAAWPILGSHA